MLKSIMQSLSLSANVIKTRWGFFSVNSRHHRAAKRINCSEKNHCFPFFLKNGLKNLLRIARDARIRREISSVTSDFIIFERNLRARCVNCFSPPFFFAPAKWKLRDANLAALQIHQWKTTRKNARKIGNAREIVIRVSWSSSFHLRLRLIRNRGVERSAVKRIQILAKLIKRITAINCDRFEEGDRRKWPFHVNVFVNECLWSYYLGRLRLRIREKEIRNNGAI